MDAWLEATLKESYQFIRVIHRSARAELRLYRNRSSGKPLAVRLMPEVQDAGVYNMLKRVRHPNLLEIYDVLEREDGTAVLEEYLDGITLAEAAGMSPLGVRRVLVQLCEGLTALHAVGIIHRDVTLSNIMLTAEGTVKLIDFDIAKIYRTAVPDPDTMGTVGYAPFEQYGLGVTDERTDLFAVGVAANMLLTGKHPSAERYKKGRLGKVIAICTQIDPDSRTLRAADLVDLLR